MPVHLVGEAEGVVRGGVLEQLLHSVTVDARPADIPHSLEIDISELQIGSAVRVSDLAANAGVVIRNEPEAVVAQISAPRVAEVEEAAAVEGEAGAEGAAGGWCRGRGRRAVVRGLARRQCPSTGWWSGSATRARSTRARATTSGPRSSSCSARRHGGRLKGSKDRARADDVRVDGHHVALAIPLTYMNDSGRGRGQAGPALRRRGRNRS